MGILDPNKWRHGVSVSRAFMLDPPYWFETHSSWGNLDYLKPLLLILLFLGVHFGL